MTKELIVQDERYRRWITELSARYQHSQIKAAVLVNSEMLKFYWSLGRDVAAFGVENGYGVDFYRTLSRDLQKALPDAKGLSATNLKYMRRFYELYSNCSQVVDNSHVESSSQNRPQLVDDFVEDVDEEIFRIPWGCHRIIIDKCKSDPVKALFYVRQTLTNNWSRAVLLNWLDSDLYDRQGKAITNFATTLPAPQSDLAQEMTRDPYCFDFLTIDSRYNEKELKDALTENTRRFLMELGLGFAFVGREYRLVVGETEQFIDLLFYHFQLHCFVVVEVKVTEFESRDMGQLATYVAAVDGILRKEEDQPTIGLLICKTKDSVLAQYAVDVVNVPVGVSEYRLSSRWSEELKNALPTVEQIEKELSVDTRQK